jgi:hypothetical protein
MNEEKIFISPICRERNYAMTPPHDGNLAVTVGDRGGVHALALFVYIVRRITN